MSESNKDDKEKKPLTLGAKPGGTLSLKGNAAAQARQNMAGGGGRGTVVEVRRRRTAKPEDNAPQTSYDDQGSDLHNLTSEERDARAKALREAQPGAAAADQKLLAGLPPAKRQEFLETLNLIVTASRK